MKPSGENLKFVEYKLTDSDIRDMEIRDRVLKEALYLVIHQTTLRKTALFYNTSKSTVHKDMVQKLPRIDMELYNEVRDLIEKNKSERSVRGGHATRKRYKKLKENSDE